MNAALRTRIDKVENDARMALSRAGGGGGSGASISITDFGGVPDGVIVQGASIGLASSDVHVPSAPFTHIGKVQRFVLTGAGAAGAPLVGTLTATSPTDATLSTPALTASPNGTLAFGTDNAGALQAAFAGLSGTGITLWFPEGVYLFSHGALATDQMLLQMGEDVTLVTSFTALGDDFHPDGVLFLLSAPQNGPTQPLSASAPAGATTIQVAALPPGLTPTSVDVPIQLSVDATFSAQGSTYIVRSVSGGGPFTLHLDRALLLPYAAPAAEIGVLTGQANDAHIAGNGVTITGPAARYVEVWGSFRTVVEGVRYDDELGFASFFAMHFEGMCVDCHGRQLTAHGPAQLTISLGERCTYEDCTVNGTGVAAPLYTLGGCVQSGLVDCYGCGSTYNFGAVAVLANAPGTNVDCYVVRGALTGNTSAIQALAAVNLRIEDVETPGNTSGGIGLGGGGQPVTGTLVDGCDVSDNPTGIAIAAGVKFTVVRATELGGCGNFGLQAQDDAQLDDVYASKGSGISGTSIIDVSQAAGSTPRVFIRGAQLRQSAPPTAGNGPACVSVGPNCRAVITDSHLILDANSAQGLVLGGVCLLRATVIELGPGAGGATYGFDIGAGTLRIGEDLTLGAGVLMFRGAGSFVSRTIEGFPDNGANAEGGKVVIPAGGAPLAQAFPDIGALDKVWLVAVSPPPAAGTLQIPPGVVITPGTGFTVNASSAADAGAKYDYVVG